VKKREKKRNCMSNVYVDCLTSAFSIFKIEANLFLKKVLKAKGEKTYIPVYNLVRLRCPWNDVLGVWIRCLGWFHNQKGERGKESPLTLDSNEDIRAHFQNKNNT
jgi:hypothetical protein